MSATASILTPNGTFADGDSPGEVDSGVACDSRANGSVGRNISRQSINRVLVVPSLSLKGSSLMKLIQVCYLCFAETSQCSPKCLTAVAMV